MFFVTRAGLFVIGGLVTHTDDSNESKALQRLSVCVSVCLHDKTKIAEIKITGTWHRDSSSQVFPPINIRSKRQGQRV